MKQLKILVVDDEGGVRDSLKAFLENRGHSVILGINGTTGIEQFKTTPCDLVITDYEMPDMNGEQMAARIKEISKTTPIVMISASGIESSPHLDLVLKKASDDDSGKLEAFIKQLALGS